MPAGHSSTTFLNIPMITFGSCTRGFDKAVEKALAVGDHRHAHNDGRGFFRIRAELADNDLKRKLLVVEENRLERLIGDLTSE